MKAVTLYERGAKHKERNDEATTSLAVAIMTALSPGIVSPARQYNQTNLVL
jgi:hypothetical protein